MTAGHALRTARDEQIHMRESCRSDGIDRALGLHTGHGGLKLRDVGSRLVRQRPACCQMTFIPPWTRIVGCE
ncbi:MAG: hypothetical protein E6447_20550, partial [Bradyrhizobium sp.]|nr:hypothetical protein [Bradyrhizobium sp.]